ncbi:hypothetical protein IQ260_20220 [Leptolyngbya cf. ectocarpi LEGE 11479]|uniref:Uncharacterized protein n=1 Tax=Leptolyngbya cf. ectocarpi LEGE 11479 TaxID=1828722 RepID=A0A928ZWW2_LEPEC|nr:hypothetical protein [Leptolyngbya ectocarpi]MBE9068974.1 hypothetical protein [Leptolyngbya cf. ectocarpi LEGE 11479]
MFINSNHGAGAPTDPPADGSLPEYQYEDIRLMMWFKISLWLCQRCFNQAKTDPIEPPSQIVPFSGQPSASAGVSTQRGTQLHNQPECKISQVTRQPS